MAVNDSVLLLLSSAVCARSFLSIKRLLINHLKYRESNVYVCGVAV